MNKTLLVDLNNLNVTSGNDSTSNSIITIILVTVLYGLVTVIAVASNVVIIRTICAQKSMKTAANYLIVSIAIADILMAVIFVPAYPIELMKMTWSVSNYSCKLFDMIWFTTPSITHSSLVAVSIVWFKLILCPSQRPLTKREGVLIAIAIWAACFFIAIPNWMFSRALKFESDAYCVSYWPSTNYTYVEAIYLLFYTFSTYFFPVVWLICIYIIILDKLLRTYSLVGRWHDDVDALKHNKQMIKMMIVVTAIQFICLGPWTVMQICIKFIYDMYFSQTVIIIVDWIAFTSTMWKPICYLVVSAKFRSNVKQTFQWFPCIKSDDY